MKKKSSKKKTKTKISSLKSNLFRELTDQELKQIKGGSNGEVINLGFEGWFQEIGTVTQY